MNKIFNGTTVETNGVRSIAGGGTGAATAEQARINLGISSGGVTSYNDLTDKPTLGTAAATASTDYASAAQGAKADSALQSNITGITGATQLTNLVQITQFGYNNTTPLSNTLYIIVG